MHGDGLDSGAFAPDAQRNLLGQRAAGHENRGGFPQLGGDARFESSEQFALAVQVAGQRGVG